jgi:hypothetical protein
MSFVRRSRLFVCLLLSGVIMISSAHAYEFSMDAAFNYIYQYYGQQGSQGFFGPFNTDGSRGTTGALGLKTGDFASVNTWVGRQIGRSGNDFASGADAVKHYMNMEFFPSFRINPALWFRAKWRIGNYGDPNNSDYLTNTRPGVNIASSDSQWTMWWLNAQTPWGIIGLGKRVEAFGLGIQNSEYNNTTEGLGLDANYGPFRINFAVRPWWIGSPQPLLKQTEFPYYNISDKNGVRQLATRFFLVYRNGPVDMGFFIAWMRWHAGPESQNRQADRLSFIPYDLVMHQGTMYLKYFNGRFFFNAELAYDYEMVHSTNKGQNRSTPLAPTGPLYIESLRFATELGVLAGPAKLSALYAFMPGADRRAGKAANKQPFNNQAGFGAYGVFRPYSYLLGYAYGSGVNAFDTNSYGYFNEASVIAARLDYAAAANLNVFTTLLWAERSSDGHGWGYIRPAQRATLTRSVDNTGAAVDQVKWSPFVSYQDNQNAPSIPDTALGWEITAGANWKLLENYTLNLTGAYWQPGTWFNFACVDKSVFNWDVPTAINRWGITPDRRIAPIIGAEVALQVDF